jgi:predicted secreted protein
MVRMLSNLKKLIFVATFNLCLFLILMIGIQNSTNKKKVNLIVSETVSLPISFIIGLSFISGSIASSLFSLNFVDKKN